MMGLPHLFHTAGALPVVVSIVLVFLGASLTGDTTHLHIYADTCRYTDIQIQTHTHTHTRTHTPHTTHTHTHRDTCRYR